jgi:hypothetical protein
LVGRTWQKLSEKIKRQELNFSYSKCLNFYLVILIIIKNHWTKILLYNNTKSLLVASDFKKHTTLPTFKTDLQN